MQDVAIEVQARYARQIVLDVHDKRIDVAEKLVVTARTKPTQFAIKDHQHRSDPQHAADASHTDKEAVSDRADPVTVKWLATLLTLFKGPDIAASQIGLHRDSSCGASRRQRCRSRALLVQYAHLTSAMLRDQT